MNRKGAGTPETSTPAQEEKVSHNVYRWERLTDTGVSHGLRGEVWNLRGFAQLLHEYFDPEQSYMLDAGGMFHITGLLVHLVDDLDKALERVVDLNVREIEAEAAQAAD